MSEPVVASGADKQPGGMKPRVSFADLKWLQAFEKFKTLQAKTKLQAGNFHCTIDWVCDDPHPPSLWIKYREDGKLKSAVIRKGDPLIFDLTSIPR